MKKKGISLILLVITIIIIIIIASAVILNLNNNNPVDKARLANVQSARDSLKSGINLYIGKIMVKENGNHYASTMILGKNSQVIDYSIIVDYSLYEVVRGNLNIWELDYQAIKSKVNVNLDIYDNNSRWYIDEYGNPFLVYNSFQNVSPYLKNDDATDIHPQVKDFVVVLDNVEFAENSTLGLANINKTSITSAVSNYLASQGATSTATTIEILTDSENGIASSTDTTTITKNDEEITLYKIEASKYNTKTGSLLPTTDDSSAWYVDKDADIYLIYESEEDIPESMSNGVSTSSYVTSKGGTITSYVASNINNSNNNSSNNNNQTSNKQDGSITLSSKSGAFAYTNSKEITVTNPNNVEITAQSSDTSVATVSVDGNTVTVTALSKAGDATISITGAETASYNAVTKTYSMWVYNDTDGLPVASLKSLVNERNISSYIGQKVNYHPSEDSSGVYRIFYLDTSNKYGDGANTIYLKRDYSSSLTYYVSTSYSGGSGYSSPPSSSMYSASDMGKFNPLWGSRDYTINCFHEAHAAYLCTRIDENSSYTRSWSKCYDKSQGAKYVIGSPSVEMYMDAYNQWGGYTYYTGPQFYTFVSGDNGYLVGVRGTYQFNGYYEETGSLSEGPNNIFYRSSGYYWLASPCKKANYSVIFSAGGTRGSAVCADYNKTYGLCPIVCLEEKREARNMTLSSDNGVMTCNGTMDITVDDLDDAVITATSSDETIATVAVNGKKVTITSYDKYGDVTITIKGSQTEEYYAVSKKFSLSVGMSIAEAKSNITSENISNYIGTAVVYRPSGDSTGVYRIFYLDTSGKYGDGNGALYIKRDYDDKLKIYDWNYYGYTTGSTPTRTFTSDEITAITNTMKKMNPLWSIRDGVLSQNNEYFSAYLCNPEEWTKYKTSEALYAIGSPSVEMYMDAYNQWGGYESGRGPQSYKFVSGEDGYSVGLNGTYSNSGTYQNQNSLSVGQNNIFYTSSKSWWLASPLRNYKSYVVYVSGDNAYLSIGYSSGYGVCPIVCLGN